MTATEPLFRILLKLALVAGTHPIQAMKCRHMGMEKTLLAAIPKIFRSG